MAQKARIRRKQRRGRPQLRRAHVPAMRGDAHKTASAESGLMIGGVQDAAERRADRTADRVMRVSAPVLHRKCDACAAEETDKKPGDEQGTVRTKTAGTAAPVAAGPAAAPASKGAAKAIGAMGPGRPLMSAERAFFEPRFGADLSPVRIHDGREGDRASRSVNARAFALGDEIAFARGEYAPGSRAGRRLMAHELAHVLEDGGLRRKLRRVWVKDTGFRYSLPATVSRSVAEIQSVVGTTPDGVYGNNTRDAVQKYQTKLKAEGLFKGTPDGKWDAATDLAHADFATGDKSENYNCTGLALKTHTFMDKTATDAALAKGTKLPSCADPCAPRQYKFWYWNYDVSLTNKKTGTTTPKHKDFHIVGGQTDDVGKGPATTVSKNGSRPVKGPLPPASWFPVTEPARTNDKHDTPDPNLIKNRTGHVETCHCLDKLP